MSCDGFDMLLADLGLAMVDVRKMKFVTNNDLQVDDSQTGRAGVLH